VIVAKGKLESLGTIDGKEYYYDLRPTAEDEKGNEIPNPDYKQVVWRVPDIREAVVAEPGYLILSADYAQIEVKLMAHLSCDPVLIAAINSGKDIHSFNATEVFGDKKHFDYDTLQAAKKDKSHPRYAELVKLRNDIKTVTFGVPYGAGANKVALMTGMTTEAAQEFIDAFFAKFSVLGQWLKKSGDYAIKYGFSLSPRGRRRFYDLPSADAKEKEKDKVHSQVRRYAGNHPIQAGNVDMLKPAMYQIYNDIREQGYDKRGARILFCVHDEIVATAREEDAVRVDSKPGPIEQIMMTRMQESYDFIITDIINKIDVAIGPIWEKA
jgi:DNA polymerase-1